MKKIYALGKVILTLSLFLVLVGFFIEEQSSIRHFVQKLILHRENDVLEKNEYYRNYDFAFVQNVENYSPENFQDIFNVYYTFFNSGVDSFSFYCGDDYTNCIEDIKSLAKNQDALSAISNYVHPYNGFSNIETKYDSFGKITINVVRNYNSEQIKAINEKLDVLYPQLVLPERSVRENILAIHDYIIHLTQYDSDRNDFNIIKYHSDIAYGPLLEGYGICGGYTDLMELFLERMGIKSFKVSSEHHVWNAVLLDDQWYHLDLTWDDPVASDGSNYLEHDFFLIPTKKLFELEGTEDHRFYLDYYPELKEASS